MSRGSLAAAGKAIGAGLSSAVRGGAAGGGPGVTSVRTVGESVYDPTLDKEVEYGEVPDEGEPVTLNGPIGVAEFRGIVAASRETEVYSFWMGTRGTGVYRSGAEGAMVSIVSPALLFGQLEVTPLGKKRKQLPVLPNPLLARTKP